MSGEVCRTSLGSAGRAASCAPTQSVHHAQITLSRHFFFIITACFSINRQVLRRTLGQQIFQVSCIQLVCFIKYEKHAKRGLGLYPVNLAGHLDWKYCTITNVGTKAAQKSKRSAKVWSFRTFVRCVKHSIVLWVNIGRGLQLNFLRHYAGSRSTGKSVRLTHRTFEH